MANDHEHRSKVTGPAFEKRVCELLVKDNRFELVRPATLEEQRIGHFDIFAVANGVTYRIECKSMKEGRDSSIILETRTVCDWNGKSYPGSLFGRANMWAFERPNGRILWVPTTSLLGYINKKSIDLDGVPSIQKLDGVLYTRRAHFEQASKIELVRDNGQLREAATRGDRMVYVPTHEVERLPKAYVWPT